MKALIDRVLGVRITVKSIALVVAGALVGLLFASQPFDGGGKAPVEVASTTTAPATTYTTSTTSTTTTTTTTVPPAPPKPSGTALTRKVDEYAPGSTAKYGADSIEEGGKMACRMWNAEAGISRIAVIREIAKVMRLNPDELTVAAAISQAALWTICPVTATFPDGPLPFDNWR